MKDRSDLALKSAVSQLVVGSFGCTYDKKHIRARPLEEINQEEEPSVLNRLA